MLNSDGKVIFLDESSSSLNSVESAQEVQKVKKHLPSFFSSVTVVPIPHHEISNQYENDKHPMKVDLRTVKFCEKDGKPWTLSLVQMVKEIIATDETLDREIDNIYGVPAFYQRATHYLLGKHNDAVVERRVFSFQPVNQINGLRIIGEYLYKFTSCKTIYIPKFDSELIRSVLTRVGIENLRPYHYWSNEKKKFDLSIFRGDVCDTPSDSVILFDCCGYDGADPNKSEWYEIANVVKSQKLKVIFFCDGLGMKTGELRKDVWSIRTFVDYGIKIFCIQSFDRNFDLGNYGVAAVTIVALSSKQISSIKAQILSLIQGMYYYPPTYGATVVGYILSNADLYQEWKGQFRNLMNRVDRMRAILRSTLECLGSPGDWSMFTSQQGFYTATSWTTDVINKLRVNHHIYIPYSGKMSMTALNYLNVEYIAYAIYETFKERQVK